MSAKKPGFIKWFADTRIKDIPLVGGKNVSPGEMYRALARKGVNVPNGFAVSAEACRQFIREILKKENALVGRCRNPGGNGGS